MAERRRTRDRGQVLMMVPAGVLILVMLAGIAVDGTQVFLAREDLASTAQAAANDAVTFGIDQTRLRGADKAIVLNDEQVREAVRRSVEAHGGGLDITGFDVRIGGDGRTVTVTVTGRVDFVFVKAIPGMADGRDITVEGEAVAQPQ